MSKQLFNNLVKLGNNNPSLRDDIKPVLHYLKTSGLDVPLTASQIKSSIEKAKTYIDQLHDWFPDEDIDTRELERHLRKSHELTEEIEEYFRDTDEEY